MKIDKSRVRGVKETCIVKCRDDGEIESVLIEYLKEIIDQAEDPDEIDKTLIFVPNRNLAERLASEAQKLLCVAGLGEQLLMSISVTCLLLSERVERNFKEGKTRILFTVKTLEIGIDIGDVKRVIHWSIPFSLNDFVQREGRAGRREGMYESIIFITSSKEEILRKWLGTIRDPVKLGNYLSRPYINVNSELMRRLLTDLRMDIRRGKAIPKEVSVYELKWPVSFYSQDKRRFKLVLQESGRSVGREVRVEDVIFRYLPGMIRYMRGSYYIVDDGMDSRQKIIPIRRLENALGNIWGGHVTNPAFALNQSYVEQGRIFTVADVATSTNIIRQEVLFGSRGDNLRFIIVQETPISTKLIRKDWKEKEIRIYDEKTGKIMYKRIKIPVFKLCGEKLLDPAQKGSHDQDYN